MCDTAQVPEEVIIEIEFDVIGYYESIYDVDLEDEEMSDEEKYGAIYELLK